MLIYIFKAVGCMAIFLLFYKLLLEQENMHVFKRFYLLLAIGASLAIPALVFTEYVLVEPTPPTVIPQSASPENAPAVMPMMVEDDVLDSEALLWVLYCAGLLFFALRFIKNLGQILNRIRRNPKQPSARFIQVLLQENFPPHTFFKYIFLNKRKLESNKIPKEVLLHEETHARQRHSWDVVFIELLQVVFWFNPLVYLYKKSIKLNHEFLADQAVLNKDIDKTTYQNTLLSYLSRDSHNKYQSKMANAINYSSIKKRFTVMKKQKSKKAVFLRSSLVLPLIALAVLGFSETRLIEVNSANTFEIEKEASPQEIARYIQLAREYNAIPITQRAIPLKDLKVLERIYNSMSIAQRQEAEPFPECLPRNIIQESVLLHIEKSRIHINGKSVPLNSIAITLDQLTKNWEETDYTSAVVKASFNDTPVSFLEKVEAEFQKTHLSKANSNRKLFAKAYAADRPQDGASRELMKEYNALAKYYNDMPRDHMKIKSRDVARLEYIYSLMSDKQKADAEPFPDFPEPPAPPKSIENPKPPVAIVEEVPNISEPANPPKATVEEVPRVSESVKPPKAPKEAKPSKAAIGEFPTPPTPPEPQSPLDHVIEMAKKGATFFYEGKTISSDQAIELLKKNQDLNIQSTGKNAKKPTVKISKSPIYLDRSAAPTATETGNIDINGNEGFYTKKNGITTYFDSEGRQVDRKGTVLNSRAENNPQFYLNGKRISSDVASQLLSSNTAIQVTSTEYPDGSYAIVLTDLNRPQIQNAIENENPNAIIDISEMIANGALFFFNDRAITTEKALWLTQNTNIQRVNTISSKKGTTEVYFWGKV